MNMILIFGTTYESGFIDLLNVHSIYIHCPDVGPYNTVGVRGGNSIIKKVPVSASFGYLILDSVVALHDKRDVSRQSLNNNAFQFKECSWQCCQSTWLSCKPPTYIPNIRINI